MMANAKGKVTQVIGAVVDVQFDDNLPEILNALTTDNNGKTLVLGGATWGHSADGCDGRIRRPCGQSD